MSKSTQSLLAIPLGGLGEFGMNMMVLRLGDDILVIDSGMMFPESELLGVDLVIPDITYLKQNRQHVRAIVLTHGHEDHIGALPYILRDLNVPVYGTRFTLALVKKRLEEAGLLASTTLREVTARPPRRNRPLRNRVHPTSRTARLTASRSPYARRSA